VIKTYKRTYL